MDALSLPVGFKFPMIKMFVFFRGQILCSLGDELGQQLPQCLPIFLDRLRNEITRLTTVKAYSLIAGYVDQLLYSPFAISCDENTWDAQSNRSVL